MIGDGLPGFVAHVKPTIEEAVNAVNVQVASPPWPIRIMAYPAPPGGSFTNVVNAIEAVHRSHSDAYRHELAVARCTRHGRRWF